MCPFWDASISAVAPLFAFALTSAPLASSARTIAASPLSAAVIKSSGGAATAAVHPIPSAMHHTDNTRRKRTIELSIATLSVKDIRGSPTLPTAVNLVTWVRKKGNRELAGSVPQQIHHRADRLRIGDSKAVEVEDMEASSIAEDRHGSRPKTATLFVVATKTFPSATTGAIYLLPAPNWSRPLDAWLLLYSSVARLIAA